MYAVGPTLVQLDLKSCSELFQQSGQSIRYVCVYVL